MKAIENTKNHLRTILLTLFALMLALSTALPSVAFAAEEGVIEVKLDLDPITVTEDKIISGFQIILDLSDPDRKWVHDISNKKELLIDSMTADADPVAWEKYKEDIKQKTTNVTVDATGQKLTLTLPASSVYEISQNETITMNLSPALIENWPGQVTPVTFDIYADPQISMSGSVMPSVTAEEIQDGGKEIELHLVNATWVEEEFYTMTGLKKFLEQFGNTPINIAEHVNLANPNDVVGFADPQTLKIKLPAIPVTGTGGTVTFNPTLLSTYTTIDTVEDGTSLGSNINGISPMSFDIKTSTASSLEIITNPNPITEENMSAGNQATITLTLKGAAEWSSLTQAKKKALIDALVAENQPDEWEKVKNALTSSNVSDVSTDNKTVEIEIPKVESYYLIANQKISLKVPHQLLVDNVDLNPVDFEIEATPKALISGTVTPEVSQADIIKGDQTIIVTLVNSVWDKNIATNTAKREQLLSGFDWGTTNTTATAIINARATVERTSDEVVTITLPPIPGFKVQGDSEVITFNPSTGGLPVLAPYLTEFNAFTIKPVTSQSATISGTIQSNTNEFDIVKGSKTITITLKNDVWAKNADTQVVKINGTDINLLMSKFTLKDAAGKPSVKKDGTSQEFPSTATVTRTSDTVMTITLEEDSGFSLKDDAVADLVIPAELLSVSSNPIDVTSAFKIAAVKAELPSKKDLVLDKSDIQKGGKTITITLKNATFIDNLVINDITSIFSGSGSDYSKIVNAINNDTKAIKTSKDKITIKLPPVPDYNSTKPATINLQIPADIINHEAARDINVDGKIEIGAVATATLSGGPFTDQQIKSGKQTITITLTGTEWDPAIETNKSKKSALLKGFTVSDQTKEWALLNKEISANGTFKLDSAKKILTITLPAVPNYSIIRDQVVDITIPKSVLVNYKDDIQVPNQLKITVPSGAISDKSLGELTAEELAKAIENNKRVIVPAKVVETIFVNTVELPSSEKVKPSITTIEITTTNAVQEVQVMVAGGTAQTVKPKGNKSIFVYTNLEKNSELKVSVFGSDKTKPLQSDIYKKIGKGSKTYSEIPKKDLTGSYSIYTLLTDKSLLKDIFKYYSIDELKVTK